jgi:tetratricopeptide (TPR) repeat protein
MNLRQLLDSQTVTPRQTLELVVQICTALQYAHEEGVVHRDIKPANILMNKKGQVKIADFGLVKLLGATPDTTLTTSQAAMGTFNYMAPEQRENAQGVDHRADIFSLGVVFYEMLTGEVPMGRFEPPSKKAQVDVRLDEVVLRALESEPARRYQSASEIRSGVEAITRVPAGATAEMKQGPWLVLLGAAALMAMAIWLRPYAPALLDFIIKPGPERLVARAKEKLEQYDFPGLLDSAIGDLRTAVGLDSNMTDAHAWLGLAYWKRYKWSTGKEDRSDALRYSSNALRCNPESKTGWFVQGLVEQDEERFTNAANSLGHANTNAGWDDGEVLIELAKVYWNLKDMSNAQYYIQRASNVRDKPWHFFNNMGDLEFGLLHYPDAETNFHEAIKRAHDSPKAWFNLGVAILNQTNRDIEEALACFQKSLSYAATDDGYWARGEYYLQIDNWLAAAADFETAAELNPYRYNYPGLAGLALMHLPEKKGEAREHLSKALLKVQSRLKDTWDPLAAANCGLYQAALGQAADAYDTLQRAMKLSPSTQLVRDNIVAGADLLDALYHLPAEAAHLRQLLPEKDDHL